FKLITEKKDNCHLKIIGNGECFEELKILVKNLEITNIVEFIGAISHSTIPKQLYKAHILLHTSLSEGQPVAAAEAAASGVVACGTRVGHFYDWDGDKCI